MKEKLEQLLSRGRVEIDASESIKMLDDIRVKYLGKSGEITALLKSLGSLPNDQKPIIGKIANEVKAALEERISAGMERMREAELQRKLAKEDLDVTLPAKKRPRGHVHPITFAREQIVEIFLRMGFSLVDGPQVESVYHNFDALNAPADHPSRLMTDTFYIDDSTVLRTQTSPVQVRVMKATKPPIRVFSIGRCFRNDTPDATHSPTFHQVEGLVVGEGITMTDLKGVLQRFAVEMFGEHTKIKFRPHYFPFTEPSGEVDVSCFKCGGSGCRFCKQSGWIEILGCGMVHPNVLSECGIDPERYTGFAFGMGLERIAMLKHEIDDMRILYENDIRLSQQF
ncbi:MAG: phenylalanine--tRNA ligase subunit alpha [Bacillota bacterium]|nr:phenylalanine--tRNA ligase subunit alpha [Bacillota bacterium]